MDAAEYCLKYLAGTETLCIHIHYGRTQDGKIEGRELHRLWGCVDADFAADLDTRRSHVGYDWWAYQREVCEAEECVSPHSRERMVSCHSVLAYHHA
jgi:hypothetical protein